MNPMTNVKNIKKLSELELKQGNFKTSWHDQYKDSAWLFVGGLPYDLTEGDIICVFSQYGEIVNINLVRDKGTGKSKGFCFLCYEDQRSTVLAIDNFNGIKILGRTIRVDHAADYKPPKDSEKMHEDTRKLISEGCAPKSVTDKKAEETLMKDVKKEKKASKAKIKKEKKSRKKKKKQKVEESSTSSSNETTTSSSNSHLDSDSGSDYSSKKTKQRKGKHSTKKHRRRSYSPSDSGSSSEEEEEVEESATSKRKRLEEKIKVLEQALNSVKNSSRKKLLNNKGYVTGSKSRESICDSHENDKPSTSSEHANSKRRLDAEGGAGRWGGAERQDYVWNEAYRSRESSRRVNEENGTRESERFRDRERYDDWSRERYREWNGREYERERYRDRSRDQYRR